MPEAYLVVGVEAHVLLALLAVVIRVVCRILGQSHPCRLTPHIQVLRLPGHPSVCEDIPRVKEQQARATPEPCLLNSSECSTRNKQAAHEQAVRALKIVSRSPRPWSEEGSVSVRKLRR